MKILIVVMVLSFAVFLCCAVQGLLFKPHWTSLIVSGSTAFVSETWLLIKLLKAVDKQDTAIEKYKKIFNNESGRL